MPLRAGRQLAGMQPCKVPQLVVPKPPESFLLMRRQLRGVFMGIIIDKAEVGPFAVNTYLLTDEETREAWLVDAGGSLDLVETMVQRNGASVQAVAATHGHIDHVAGAAEACRHFGVPFLIHPDDEPLLATLGLQARLFGFPQTDVPAVGRHLNDGEMIRIGRSEGKVIHTPGHTPGGICLFFEESALLVTGDTLFAGSVGRTDLPGGNSSAIVRSIRERIYALPGDPVFFPGHGPRGRLSFERGHNACVRAEG